MNNFKKEKNTYSKNQWTEEYENDESVQSEYSLEEYLEKRESECPCPTCQGTNIGWGYDC